MVRFTQAILLCSFSWLSLLWLALSAEATTNSATPNPDQQTLLLIMIDGARWDLMNSTAAPNLVRLVRAGVQGEMIPVWPTMSSPNHWALVTGLYPIHSGVYDNSMYDRATGGYFDPSKDSWAHGEPIWAAVSRQGGISGVIGGWAGSQVTEGSKRPSFHIPYKPAKDDCDHCADLILQLLDQDAATRPKLLSLYLLEPDHSQHLHGVGSLEANKAIARIDRMMGDLLIGLAERGLIDKVNIIVVADHGQISVREKEEVYYIDDLIDMNSLAVTPALPGKRWPLMSLWPKKPMEDVVYNRLYNARPHLHVFRPSDLPPRWHCCDSDRVPPIIVNTDPGWSLSVRSSNGMVFQGVHGYDNALRDMHALFIAAGPAIKTGAQIKPFENVDLYSLMAEILKVQPAKSDGSLMSLCPIFVNPPASCTSHVLGDH